MFRSLINLFTVRRWIAIGAFVLVAVGGLYYLYGTTGAPSTLQGNIGKINVALTPDGEGAGRNPTPGNDGSPVANPVEPQANQKPDTGVLIQPIQDQIKPLDNSKIDLIKNGGLLGDLTQKDKSPLVINNGANDTPPADNKPLGGINPNVINNNGIPSAQDLLGAESANMQEKIRNDVKDNLIAVNTPDAVIGDNARHPVLAPDSQPAGRVLSPSDSIFTTVFSAIIIPSQTTTLQRVSISLKPGIASPIIGSDLEAKLFVRVGLTEKQVGTTVQFNQSGVATFIGLNKELLQVTRGANAGGGFALVEVPPVQYELIVRVRILNTQTALGKSFALQLTRASDIEFSEQKQQASGAFPIVGNLMSVQAALAADPMLPVREDPPQQDVEQVVDVCPNLDGAQPVMPAGLAKDAIGNCVDEMLLQPAPVNDSEDPPLNQAGADVCPNIAGDQAVIPDGMIQDANNNCIPPENTPQNNQNDTFDCSVLGLYPYDGPARPNLSAGSCIACPTNVFIQNNGSCDAPPAPIVAVQTPNEPQTTVSNNQHGAAFEGTVNANQPIQPATQTAGNPNLAQSQRIVRAPERGSTGPESFIYLIALGVAPAVTAYWKKGRK